MAEGQKPRTSLTGPEEIATAAQAQRQARYERESELKMQLLDIKCTGHQDEGLPAPSSQRPPR
jgi:hypothetical protein